MLLVGASLSFARPQKLVMMDKLFGKQKTPKEMVRGWTGELKKEMRTLDRDSNKIKREEEKIKAELKKEAAAGNKNACTTLAKALVQSRQAREKLLLTRTQINSVVLTLKQNYSSMQVAKTMGKSAVIMGHMNRLMNVPQISKTCQAMSKEMMKAGPVVIFTTIPNYFLSTGLLFLHRHRSP